MANGHSTEDQEKVEEKPLELLLRKYLLLLAIMAATVTYATGFNPPGGVWQDTEAGHLAGDSIIRDTYYPRYLVFFYCNAAAFVLSIIVIILILSLAIAQEKKNFWIPMLPLRVAMVLDLLGLVGAYAAGTSRAVLKPRNAWVLAVIFVYMVIQLVLTSLSSCTGDGKKEEAKEQLQTADGKEEKINKLSQSGHKKEEEKERRRKLLLLLATFVMSVTYLAGLSAPGGYWDSSKEGHNAGDLVMREHHAIRLKAFFVFNAAAFVMSLLIIMLLLDKQLVIPLLQDQDQSMTSRVRTRFLKAYIIIALVGLVGAYDTGSSRNSDTTIYVGCLVFAVLACILFLKVIISPHPQGSASDSNGRPSNGVKKNASNGGVQTNTSNADILEKAQSLVVLLSTLVTTVTYQAGLIPPGGVWQENWKEHEAGNPILLSIQPERYKVFFYCNSIAFAVSLVIIILVQYKPILKHHILELAMIMDLFGLIGAYSAGSCRDVTTSIYVIALAGVVLVYVVIHVIFITLDEDMGKKDGDKDKKDEGKRRKRLLLFAVLCTTLTYQAGLTPPGGFWLKDDEFGHHAGNEPANSQDEEERVVQKSPPAQDEDVIEQETQTLKPSETMSADEIKEDDRTTKSADIENAGEAKNNTSNETNEKEKQERAATESNEKEDESKKHAKRKYFMLLGVLAASVTYQAGLNPPGGVWQGNSNGRAAGNPVMHDNKRYRYLIFFYSNSASFVASVVIILLLKEKLLREDWLFKVMNITIVLNLLGLLLAYMAGSRMRLESSGYFIAFVIAALGIAAIHKIWSRNRESK
uniref:PGG domain-containing protein n=1 Tax=Oryza rufipogon TaxID=4529 RepID=A0A0E0PWM7_ORYRU